MVRARPTPVFYEIKVEDLKALGATKLDIPVLSDIELLSFGQFPFHNPILSDPLLHLPIFLTFE